MTIASILKGCLFITLLKESRNKLIFSGSQRKQRRLWVTKVNNYTFAEIHPEIQILG
jgi:hypothetical protein